MKKLITIFCSLLVISQLVFGATLTSMSKEQIEQAFVNKTFTSVPTDNLNGRTIDNTFSMFLDDKGNMWGKMAHQPTNEPQTDRGTYNIASDGTIYFTWQHWDGAKKLCGHIFETKNSYISVDCSNVFHTVFMKDAAQSGNKLK